MKSDPVPIAPLVLVGVLVLGMLATWLYLSSGAPANRSTEPGTSRPQSTTGPTGSGPMRAEKLRDVETTRNPINVSVMTRLPDGSYAPTLNRVMNPPPMRWPADRAYSKIKGSYVDRQGQEWYLHEDGSHSTVYMEFRNDLGREDSTWRVLNPVAALPKASDAMDGK